MKLAPDPILDPIEAYRTAWARVVDAHENLQAALSKDAFESELKARDREGEDAKNKILKAPPATLAGAQADVGSSIASERAVFEPPLLIAPVCGPSADRYCAGAAGAAGAVGAGAAG